MLATPLLVAAPFVGCSLAAAQPVTTATLLSEMIDLRVLAAFPDPPYKVVQFSSYDRSSVAPYAPGWYANSDGFGGEPTPNFLATLQEPDADGVGRYLMVDVTGPGAIVRCWTAAINGEVAVYLDGSEEPLYQGSAADFLGRTYSELAMRAGLITEPIPPGFRQEQACYFPISFAKGCRIEWIGKVQEIHFYQVETRVYPAGTPVRTFSLDDLRTHADQIERTLAVLRDSDANYPLAQPRAEVQGDITVEPGERVPLLEVTSGGLIQRFSVKVESADLHRALRGVVLKGYFDGAPQPQIEAPLGDFFGSGPGVSPYDSLPMTVRPDGTMVCRLPMPFRERALFELHNLGPVPARVIARAEVADYEWIKGRSLHLTARWRVDHGLTAAGGEDAYDLPYVCARGRGALVGVAAMLMNPCPVPTSYGNWWGEGDEKVWVDDDPFPSLFGTGSEDYYNYAWSRADLFSHAYCAQPLDTGPDNRGFVTNNRWHILDALPFEQRIDFFMELMHHSRTPGLTYARIAYLYAEPSLRDDLIPLTSADVTQGLDLPGNWQPFASHAAQGATFYQAEDCLVGEPANVTIAEDAQLWSAGKLVLWQPQAEGETIDLRLNVAQAGRYQVVATCAVTPESGRFAVAMDSGEPMRPVADLFTPHHTMLRNFFFNAGDDRVVELSAGEHTLTFIARGRRDAGAGTDIGLDFIWLLPR